MQNLKGKIAVVSGASRGAGRGIALVLGEAGATVYVTGRSVRGASTRPELPNTTVHDTAEQINERGGAGIPICCDHTIEGEVEALFERVKREHGQLDILVNNAWGVYEEHDGPFYGPFWEWSIERWNKMLSAGVWSTMAASYFAAPLMLPQRQGLIVNTMVDVGEYSGDFLFYDIAKATINHIASGTAVDLRAYNIAVVALGLGWTRTEAVMNSIPPNGAPSKEEYHTTASVEFAGRAVVALATDRNVMDKSGKVTRAENLADEYGFTDVDGTQPKWYDQQSG